MLISFFVLLFFGSKQIPDLMRGLGRATREFKDAMNGIEREVRNATNVENEKPKEEPKQLPGISREASIESAEKSTDSPNSEPQTQN